MGFRVWGLGFRAEKWGDIHGGKVRGSESRVGGVVQGLGFRIECLRFVYGFGWRSGSMVSKICGSLLAGSFMSWKYGIRCGFSSISMSRGGSSSNHNNRYNCCLCRSWSRIARPYLIHPDLHHLVPPCHSSDPDNSRQLSLPCLCGGYTPKP